MTDSILFNTIIIFDVHLLQILLQKNSISQKLQNPGQRVIDGVSYISETVYNVSSEPSRYLSSWMADQIAPKYWELNAEIIVKYFNDWKKVFINSKSSNDLYVLLQNCAVCKRMFDAELTKHHCRACGKGVCKTCSTKNRPVPERGWTYPVRVCDSCIVDSG